MHPEPVKTLFSNFMKCQHELSKALTNSTEITEMAPFTKGVNFARWVCPSWAEERVFESFSHGKTCDHNNTSVNTTLTRNFPGDQWKEQKNFIGERTRWFKFKLKTENMGRDPIPRGEFWNPQKISKTQNYTCFIEKVDKICIFIGFQSA